VTSSIGRVRHLGRCGLAPKNVGHILGVAKAYCTRVGEGPLPTELLDDVGSRLREIGGEFGSLTGRPRRCGWFDTVTSRHAVLINGIDGLVITKMDVLDRFSEIRICTSYKPDGKTTREMPGDCDRLTRAGLRDVPGVAERHDQPSPSATCR
jgi:adenylosuccinate synthase